jgi:N-acetylmuramoyl-L-alanine amidase
MIRQVAATARRLDWHSPLFICVMAALLTACAPLAPVTAMKVSRIASPNFDERRPNLVIIHHTTDNTLDEAVSTLTSPERKVSAHYLIGRDGSIVQLVEENARAWHAGKSWWGGHTDINSASLGIELDNNGHEPFADAQIDALLALLADIRERYNIPAANFIGHADVAPARKDDPSALFPWQRLAAQGFGLWCDAPLPPAPLGFDLAMALAALGYDPATPDASRLAFRRHFIRSDQAPSPEDENALAFCLLQKKASPSQ